MSVISKLAMLGAAGSIGAGGSYIAVGHKSAPRFTLLDHTTAGTVSVATTVTVGSGDGFSAQFSPDGNYVAVVTQSANELTLLDTSTPGSASTSDSISTGVSPRDLSFSPDGTKIALCSTGTADLKVYSISGGSLSLGTSSTISGTSVTSSSVDFSPDGSYIVVLGEDNFAAKLWLYSYSGTLSLSDTYAIGGSLGTRHAVRFSPDGSQVAFSSGSKIYLMNVSSGAFGSVTSDTLASGTAYGMAWNPRNNQIVALRSSTSQLLAYDTTSTPSLSANGSYTLPANSFAFGFSPDGNYLAASVDDATNKFYLLDSSVDGSFTLSDTLTTDLYTTGARLSFSPY